MFFNFDFNDSYTKKSLHFIRLGFILYIILHMHFYNLLDLNITTGDELSIYKSAKFYTAVGAHSLLFIAHDLNRLFFH